MKTLEIRYRMGHDLVAMGLKPAPQAPAPQEPAPQVLLRHKFEFIFCLSSLSYKTMREFQFIFICWFGLFKQQ